MGKHQQKIFKGWSHFYHFLTRKILLRLLLLVGAHILAQLRAYPNFVFTFDFYQSELAPLILQENVILLSNSKNNDKS